MLSCIFEGNPINEIITNTIHIPLLFDNRNLFKVTMKIAKSCYSLASFATLPGQVDCVLARKIKAEM